MFACFSAKTVAKDGTPLAPPKPPKPGGSKSTLPVSKNLEVTMSAPPAAPPKPKALQGRASVAKAAKGEYRSEEKGTVHAMVGPSKGAACLTVPFAKEEVSKDGSEKYYAYTIEVRLLGGKVHTCKYRFSEIATFHKEWQSMYPGVEIECPKKQIGMSDEDIARRCADIQIYLREMCDLPSLIYSVAKFLNLEESDLKAAIKGRAAGSEQAASSSVTSPSSKGLPKLPKVRLDTTVVADDNTRHSVDKRKLPKVKLADIDNNSPSPSSSPPPLPDPPRSSGRNDEPPPPPMPPKPDEAKKENPPTPTPVAVVSVPQPASPATPVKEQQKAPATPKENNSIAKNASQSPAIPPSRKDPAPVSYSKAPAPVYGKAAAPVLNNTKTPAPVTKTTPTSTPVKGASAGEKVDVAANPAGNGMSVKERMAAFQKKN